MLKALVNVRKQSTAGFCQQCLLAVALEQLALQIFFQLSNLLTHGGLGNIQLLCRPFKALFMGGSQEKL